MSEQQTKAAAAVLGLIALGVGILLSGMKLRTEYWIGEEKRRKALNIPE